MMNAIEGSLYPGERLVYRTRPHWAALGISAVGGLLTAGTLTLCLRNPYMSWVFQVALLALPWGVFVTLSGLLQTLKSEFAVTTERVILRNGWLHEHVLDLPLARVGGVAVCQSWPGRLLGYGSVCITSTDGMQESFSFVLHPVGFRQAVHGRILERPEQGVRAA